MRPGPESNIPVGTIIVCWKDCGYLKVDAVTPEGLLCKSAFGPELYSWDTLEWLEAAIHLTPDSPDYAASQRIAKPPRLARRGGAVTFDAGGTPSIDVRGIDEDTRRLDLAIMRGLALAAPTGWKQLLLDVEESDLQKPAGTLFVNVTSNAGVDRSLPLTPHVVELIREHRHQHMNGSWSGFELKVKRISASEGIYDIAFRFHQLTTSTLPADLP